MNNFFLLTLIIIFSCTSSPRYTAQKVKKDKSNPNSKKVKTIPVKPAPKFFDKSKTIFKGVSSYYGKDFHGKLTANGEVFDMYGITAAHKTIPLNTVVRVTNLDNSKSIILRINDRGPYIEGRMLDCSYGAAKKLGFINAGMANVEMKVIEWGDNKYMHH